MGKTGLTLILTLLITAVIGFLGFYWRIRGRKIQESQLDSDWLQFEKAISDKNFDLIDAFGIELAYNVHLKKDQLEVMSETIDSLIIDHPELEKLRLAILNKKLHYERQPAW
jgi:hypothetical protein